MEKADAVTIEGENYEVVDECIGDEDTSANAQQKSVNESVKDEKCNNIQQDSIDVHLQHEDKSVNIQPESMEKCEENKKICVSIEKSPVGEGIKNDTPVNIKQKSVENVKTDEILTKVVPIENNSKDKGIKQDEVPVLNSTNHTEVTSIEKEGPQQSVESIDFTADISLEQLNKQKDVTAEDVSQTLDVVESTVLDSSDIQSKVEETPLKETTEKNVSNAKKENIDVMPEVTNDEINPDKTFSNITKNCEQEVKPEEPAYCEWYEKKLVEKETIIRERLSKVARVLAISYPCYDKWLELEEKMGGSPLCKLKPTRRCCLDKPYTNRWKFICSRRKVSDNAPKVENSDSSSKYPETVWKMDKCGAWGVDLNNDAEFPPFVLRAVKIFEDFLQTTEQLNSQNSVHENFSDDISLDVESKKEVIPEGKPDWCWLVVRCNSMDELMLFATGRNISRGTMDRLKQVYESGPGKDCNVKSLYCKSTNKYNDTLITDTTFLVGSEALDEVVGGLRVQLAPKTNFWSNAAGAENVAKAVIDMLAPTPKSTVLEIGCGIGLIGLMMASACQQVIGVDSPSEVEEAEMICELNNIKNASFIMGSPAEVTSKIIAATKNRRTCAVINANTNIGRAIEVMTCLRKVPSLKRIVMITTLTKQSVRAILELARPGVEGQGAPFIPISACAVDTLPIGPHFEAVILMQRRAVARLMKPRSETTVEVNVKKPEIKNAEDNAVEWNPESTKKKTLSPKTEIQPKKLFNKTLIKHCPKKSKLTVWKKMLQTKNPENSFVKNKLKGKRPHSPDKGEAPPKKLMKNFGKLGAKPWHKDFPTKKKKEWIPENAQLRLNPAYQPKVREPKEQKDLRERLSNNRVGTDIAQTVKEHQALLEIAKEKLSGPAPTVDVNTAKQLQNMLNMVLEQTNKLQSQLPRSVWDRIAPPENSNSSQGDNKHDDFNLKNRFIKKSDSEDILVTAQVKKFSNNEETATKSIYKKYNNLPPLEPNMIAPSIQSMNQGNEGMFRLTPERYQTEMRPQQTQEDAWNRDRPFQRNRWNQMENMKKSNPPVKREYCGSPPKGVSPKRPLLSPPRRPSSPPRRHFSPLHRPTSPIYRQRSPVRRQMSPLRRPMSPPKRPLSPRRPSPAQRPAMLMNRPMSPLRRQVSPLRRQMSPMRSTNMSPSRRQLSPLRRPMSPLRRQIPSPNRLMCPNNNRSEMLLPRRQQMSQERHQTPTIRRAGSPQRFTFDRAASPPRRQPSPQKRQISPQRFADDWDIPSRGAIEQSTWNRITERMPEQNMWRIEKSPMSNNNWEQNVGSDKRRKTFDQDANRSDIWIKGENSWNTSKQMLTKPVTKEAWPSNSDNRWSSTANMPGSSNNNWNIRGRDSFVSCKEPWIDNKKQGRWESINVRDSWKQNDKDDLNDLPEDAKDPWGDDGISDLKERWRKFDGTGTSSMWTRENEQGDSWTKNKGSSFSNKPQWQNNGMQNVESRWVSQNDIEKKPPSGWQSGNNVGSWQFKNSNLQSQRPFSSNQFKGLY